MSCENLGIYSNISSDLDIKEWLLKNGLYELIVRQIFL